MKKNKFVSLLLAMVMTASLAVPVFAETHSTLVKYVGRTSETYNVTVPASLKPGDVGTVEIEGTWPSNSKITITAPTSVTLTNSINSKDTKTLNIEFAGIEASGSNDSTIHRTENISVGEIKDALFGTWTGTITYNITTTTTQDTSDDLITFTVNGISYQAEQGMTWKMWVYSPYNTDKFVIGSSGASNSQVNFNGHVVILHSSEIIEAKDYHYSNSSISEPYSDNILIQSAILNTDDGEVISIPYGDIYTHVLGNNYGLSVEEKTAQYNMYKELLNIVDDNQILAIFNVEFSDSCNNYLTAGNSSAVLTISANRNISGDTITAYQYKNNVLQTIDSSKFTINSDGYMEITIDNLYPIAIIVK